VEGKLTYIFVDVSRPLYQYIAEGRDRIFLSNEIIKRHQAGDCGGLYDYLNENDLIDLCKPSQSSIIVVFVRKPSRETLLQFFPIAAWTYLESLNGIIGKSQIEFIKSDAARKFSFWETLRAEIARARNNLRGLQAAFRNKHVLLLPFRTWDMGETELMDLAFDVFQGGFLQDSILAYAETSVAAFTRKYRPELRKRPRWFKNKRDVFFKHAEPSELHGHDWSDNQQNHNNLCRLWNAWRFGVPIDPSFHFDIQHENSRVNPISCELRNCHGAIRGYKKKTHINVWRNDFNKD
jgi:hypothetical protein